MLSQRSLHHGYSRPFGGAVVLDRIRARDFLHSISPSSPETVFSIVQAHANKEFHKVEDFKAKGRSNTNCSLIASQMSIVYHNCCRVFGSIQEFLQPVSTDHFSAEKAKEEKEHALHKVCC